MKKLMNRSFIWAAAIAAMVGCQRDYDTLGSSSDEAVAFSSTSIATRTTLNVDQTYWQKGDGIAISAPELGYNHLAYTADDYGLESSFSPAGDQIYKSSYITGDVAYSAYYPSSAYVNGSYVLDVADQTENYNDFDFLYAEKSTSSKHVEFTFNHALAFLQFSINFLNNTGTSVYESIKIGDVTTKASYKVKNSSMVLDTEQERGDISMYKDNTTGSHLKVYAIVHPISYGGKIITFTIDGKEYHASYPDDAALEAGKVYSHNVTVGENETIIGSASIYEWVDDNVDMDDEFDFAYENIWDGNSSNTFEGANSAQINYNDDIKTYYIKTGSQLAYLAVLANDDSKNLSDKSFILLNNIDLNGNDWTSIGTTTTPFEGTFNGMGYTISGLSVKDADDSSLDLFGEVATEAVIENLTVINSAGDSKTYQ